MHIPEGRMHFVNRNRELTRLHRVMDSGGMVCVWGRRRLGKSRLLREAVSGRPVNWVVGDDRDAPLQREAVAREIGRLLPAFDAVHYPNWDTLLERYWRDAPRGGVLVLDEFPLLVQRSPELPGILQHLIDKRQGKGTLALCGSSQRMMHGLVLDASAPLFGRADEILRIEPLSPRWMKEALGLKSDVEVVRRYAVFGGVPRHWELMARYPDLMAAVRGLVLDPLGVLHDEPQRLLLDDVREVARAASILSLIGGGATRISEIAARIGQPSTSLMRPMERLVSLGWVARETPFGVAPRDTKRSFYRIADPFLSFWYRWVDPNRSRLSAGQFDIVAEEIARGFNPWLGLAWETLVRWSVPRSSILGSRWGPASRWWGAGGAGEIDVLAESIDQPATVLVGEVKLNLKKGEVRGCLDQLRVKAARCPALVGKTCVFAVWVLHSTPKIDGVLGADAVVAVE